MNELVIDCSPHTYRKDSIEVCQLNTVCIEELTPESLWTAESQKRGLRHSTLVYLELGCINFEVKPWA